MNNEILSFKQSVSILTMFTIGTSIILIMGVDAKQDLWIAHILSLSLAVPIILMYCRVTAIFPNKNLLDIFQICFGNIIGKLIVSLYTWYCIHIASLILCDFSMFGEITSSHRFSTYETIFFLLLLNVFMIKAGIETFGRWAEFFLLIILFFVVIQIVLLWYYMDINRLFPILYNGFSPVFKSMPSIITFPYTETIIFIVFFSNFQTGHSNYKIFIVALLISGVVLLLNSLSNILVLGLNGLDFYFPTIQAVSFINIKSSFQRAEIISSTMFFLCGFAKLSLCLFSTCKGFSCLFSTNDYRFIAVPVALLTFNLTTVIYTNMLENIEWAIKISPFYSIPFALIIPIITWVICEIKKNRTS